MKRKTRQLTALSVVIVCAIGGVIWQGAARADLRRALAERQTRDGAWKALRMDHARLLAEAVTPEEALKWQTDREALERLRGEIAMLRQDVESQERGVRRPVLTESRPPAPAPRPTPPFVSADHWKNAGFETPAGSIETALWAAAGGDIAAFASACVLDAEARARAEALWMQLPEETRAGFESPERLIASLVITDVPADSAQFFEPVTTTPEQARMRVRLRTSEGRTRTVVLTLRRAPDGWKLVVPDAAVEKYARGFAVPQ